MGTVMGTVGDTVVGCSAGGGMMRPPVRDRREQMPVYVCRWPNGDCSVVQARTKQAAIIKLDEMDNAEGCPLIRLDECQVPLDR